jgi:iron complex transport system substrate-binding protein
VILLAPCGYTLDQSERELQTLLARPEWRRLPAARAGRVALIDGSAYFARPGPRLKESLAIAGAAIHPDACHDLAPAFGFRLLDHYIP